MSSQRGGNKGGKNQAGSLGRDTRGNKPANRKEKNIATPVDWADETTLGTELSIIKETASEENFIDAFEKLVDLLSKVLTDNQEKNKKIENLELQLKELEEKTQLSERKWKREKCFEKRNDFIIRGVELHEGATGGCSESQQQTEDVCDKILADMGAVDKVQIKSVKRLKVLNTTNTTNSKKKKSPAILVSLKDEDSKSNLFKCLGSWKRNAKNRQIRFVQDFPDFLRQENDELEKTAWNIRTSSKGKIKTRIFLENGELILKTKTGKDKWKQYDLQNSTS